MFPTATIFGKEISMYGVMVAAGLIASLVYFKLYEKKRTGTTSADVELASLFGGIGAFFGAKLLYIFIQFPSVVADLPLLTKDPLTFITRYLSSGFVFYGGLYGALAGVWLYARKNHLSVFNLAQTLTPVIPLFHAFGRVGCFLEGCCYGRPARYLPGIAFTRSNIAPNHIPLLPVQLYEAAVELILFVILAVMANRNMSGKLMTSVYLLSYSVCRFFLEFLRGDFYRGFIGPLSLSQWIAIVTVFLAIGMQLMPGKGKSGQKYSTD